MIKVFFVLFLSVYLSMVHANNDSYPNVPVLISDVETHRVGKRVVRLIRSFSDEGFLFVELLKPPKFSLIDRSVIDKIKVKIDGFDRVLDFRETASVSIENLKIDKGVVKFQVDFYMLRGGRHLSDCSIDVRIDKIPEPVCYEVIVK